MAVPDGALDINRTVDMVNVVIDNFNFDFARAQRHQMIMGGSGLIKSHVR
jgi:uncharacterized protein (DUF849 family)